MKHLTRPKLETTRTRTDLSYDEDFPWRGTLHLLAAIGGSYGLAHFIMPADAGIGPTVAVAYHILVFGFLGFIIIATDGFAKLLQISAIWIVAIFGKAVAVIALVSLAQFSPTLAVLTLLGGLMAVGYAISGGR
jgi:hypothetical protein